MKKVVLGLLLLCTAQSVFSSEKVVLHQDITDLIDVWLNAQLDYEGIPYMSVGYVTEGQVVWHGSYGVINTESNVPASENTISSICSTTKLFTATAIMKLVDEGKVGLDQKVSQILPNLKINHKHLENGEMTVRSLLTHTSGLPRDTEHAYWSGPEHGFPSKGQLKASLATLPSIHNVNEQVEYSNVGMALLGLIIEQVSNKSYKDYIESELLQPLGMTDSVVEMSENNYGGEHALGYTAKLRNGNRELANFYKTRAMQPAAGMSSNAKDLAKFALWQLNPESNIKLMRANAIKKMFEPHVLANGEVSQRGLGYQVYTDNKDVKWATHGGMCPGYTSFVKLNLTDNKAITFTNSANGVRALAYVNNLNELLRQAEQVDFTEPTTTDLTEYEGFYDLRPWNSEYYVGKWGPDIVLLYLPVDSIKYSLYRYKEVGKDTFQLFENGQLKDETIRFNRNSANQVVSVTNEGGVHNKLN